MIFDNVYLFPYSNCTMFILCSNTKNDCIQHRYNIEEADYTSSYLHDKFTGLETSLQTLNNTTSLLQSQLRNNSNQALGVLLHDFEACLNISAVGQSCPYNTSFAELYAELTRNMDVQVKCLQQYLFDEIDKTTFVTCLDDRYEETNGYI